MPISHALDAEGIDLVILLIDEDHIDRPHVRVHRHMIVGEIMGHESPEAMIGRGFLVQRHTDAPDHRAENLTARDFGLRMRPAATALTTRVTRMTPSCSSILTSANTAECVQCAYSLSDSARRWLFFDPVGLAGRITSVTETSWL